MRPLGSSRSVVSATQALIAHRSSDRNDDLQAPSSFSYQSFIDRLNDPVTREVLDRLVEQLQSRHDSVFDMLKRLDVNGDGELDRAEIRRGLLGMRIALTSSELDSVIHAFDKSGTGTINYMEFYDVIRNHRVEKAMGMHTTPSRMFTWQVSPVYRIMLSKVPKSWTIFGSSHIQIRGEPCLRAGTCGLHGAVP